MNSIVTSELLKDRKITADKLTDVRRQARELGEPVEQVLIKKGLMTEFEVLEHYRDALSVPLYETLGDRKVPARFIEKIPAAIARNYNLVGIEEREDETIVVATCRPFDLQPTDEVGQLLGVPVEPVLAPRVEINALINKGYQAKQELVDQLEGQLEDDEDSLFDLVGGDHEDILEVANKAPVIRLVNSILFQALKMRASDIHVQPFEYKLQVRYRIDGILHDQMTPPKKLQEAVVSRIKVMGKMDIAERRMPQDGRATIRLGDSEVDIRISSVPTAYGERVVLRLLDKSARMYELPEIGLMPDNAALLTEFINYSHGVILLTGPTGSGKTTTLYAALNRINATEKNVITIEDPIEYQIHNVSQIEVNPKKGLTFAEGLRSIVRQDPDVIMVGEIRDPETAEIAIQSALTGHLVFSTLHTNDAPSATTRLVHMGVEPFLVSSSVICVVAQRLVRLNCKNCTVDYEPTDDESHAFGLERDDDGTLGFALPGSTTRYSGALRQGPGCHECFNTGYLDRTAIHEILPVTDHIKEQIMENASAAQIKNAAVRAGLVTLRTDALRKALQGITTLEEVARVTQRDIH